MIKNLKNIKKDLRSSLDKDRYQHTIAVSYTAICLAMKYEVDLKKAEVAGLLHDCAKCVPDDRKMKQCLKHNIKMTDAEIKQPYLLHAKLGAFVAMNKYGITDKEIINAILKHTTGAPNMTKLEKIIFIADYIEPNRYKAQNLSQLRKMAFENLDLTVYQILKDTLAYLHKNNVLVDEMTQKAYDYYKDSLDIE